jgi:hypothetical protein
MGEFKPSEADFELIRPTLEKLDSIRKQLQNEVAFQMP